MEASSSESVETAEVASEATKVASEATTTPGKSGDVRKSEGEVA